LSDSSRGIVLYHHLDEYHISLYRMETDGNSQMGMGQNLLVSILMG
jgi:hypothetical protein